MSGLRRAWWKLRAKFLASRLVVRLLGGDPGWRVIEDRIGDWHCSARVCCRRRRFWRLWGGVLMVDWTRYEAPHGAEGDPPGLRFDGKKVEFVQCLTT